MTDAEHIERLGSLFVAVTGDTSVVERQSDRTDTRVVEERSDDRAVGTVEHHGLSDAIDQPSSSDDSF